MQADGTIGNVRVLRGVYPDLDNEAVRVTTLNAYFDELSKCSDFDRWFFGSLHLDKYISNSYIGVHKALVNAHTGERVSI